MSKLQANDLVDIFQEEEAKKSKRELKKQQKLEKKLEKKENLEFQKLAKQEAKKKKSEKKEPDKDEKEIEKTQQIKKENLKKEKSPITVGAFLYDLCFGFFLILLLLAFLGYSGILLYESMRLRHLAQVGLLGIFTIFYILSMVTKKEGIKKFCSILASIGICGFMIFTLYFA